VRKLVLIIMLAFIRGVVPAQGADIQINAQFNASTGDSDFDAFPRHMNVSAGDKLNVFITDLGSTYNVPPDDVLFLIYEEKARPADAFMILQLVRVTGKPVKKVVKRYRKHRGRGWGAVAHSFGIKPGSRTYLLLIEDIPTPIWDYSVVEVRGSKGSKGKKHKKHHRHKRGSKGKGSKGEKHH